MVSIEGPASPEMFQGNSAKLKAWKHNSTKLIYKLLDPSIECSINHIKLKVRAALNSKIGPLSLESLPPDRPY